MAVSRVLLLAAHALPDLLDPRSWRADRAAAARLIDRTQSTSVSSLPLHRAVAEAVLRFLEAAPGARLVQDLTADEAADPRLVAGLLHVAPGLEPRPRGPAVFETVTVRRATSRRRRARQGHLGDCWLIAALAACENAAPGFLDRLVTPVGRSAGSQTKDSRTDATRTDAARTDASHADASREEGSAHGEAVHGEAVSGHSVREEADLVVIDLALPRLRVPGLRRLPFLPVRRAPVTVSARVPVRHRAGDARVRASVVSLVEKAAVIAWADGSYRRLQNDFAGIGLLLATGRWSPARPVPRRVETVGAWLEEGRPVVLSTLKRPGGSFELPREDGTGTLAFMDAHVYVARKVHRCDEDGRPGEEHPLRLHVHNPLGGSDSRRRRRTDLHLSADQMRRAFISTNVGPVLRDR